jgi:hypothetical protein
MKNVTAHFLMAAVSFGFLACQTYGGVVTYVATDLGAGPNDPRPNSNAMAATFDAAAASIGSVSTINFESAPLGSFTALTVAPGVSIDGTDVNNNNQSIRNTSNFPIAPSLDGFNTTAGGSQFVELMGGNLVFTFAHPTQFFGVYLTGVQTFFFPDSITFNDGTNQTILVPGEGTSNFVGEVAFIGFTDAGKLISSVTINAGIPGNPNAGFDDIGADDVRFQSAVPEPSSLSLAGTAVFAALGLYARRRRLRRSLSTCY